MAQVNKRLVKFFDNYCLEKNANHLQLSKQSDDNCKQNLKGTFQNKRFCYDLL